MNLYEFKKHLTKTEHLSFQLPDETCIPEHFHITEVAMVDKTYIDCGGVRRHEQVITLQIWVTEDTHHRLTPKKLLKIIEHSQSFIDNELLPIQVEYQGSTIGRYDLTSTGGRFILEPLFTNCLAKDACGISPSMMPKITITSCCGKGGCC